MTRLHLPRVVAIEVWDVPVAGKMLQEWRACHEASAFAARLADAVVSIRGAPPAAWSARARAAAPAIARVHLVGGGVDAAARDAIAAAGLPCTWSRDPFAAARAGAALRPGALCADVGQTGIKLVHEGRAWRIDRDLARAPLRDEVPPARRREARGSTLRFLAEALAGHAAAAIVALPCELTDAGVPRSCTYCWPDPDPDLVSDLARLAGMAIQIVNDAELAAVAAERELPEGATALVLTLGFGVGGAILT